MKTAWAAVAASAMVFPVKCPTRPPTNRDRQIDSTELVRREARLEEALSKPDTGPMARWILPRSLAEISGITLIGPDRVLAHGDEDSQLYEIDYRRGVVVGTFTIGQSPFHADFEGVTHVDDWYFLLASNGHLYRFKRGSNGSRVGYHRYDTKLGHECEFEGVAFDPAIRSLLLACKIVKLKKLDDRLVIYRWKLDKGEGPRLSRLTVDIGAVAREHGWKTFHPSDITLDPTSGNYVLIASNARGILEITPSGQVVMARPLPGTHRQPEGVAISSDGILIVTDEQGGGPAAVMTLYRWPLSGRDLSLSRPPSP